MSSDGRIRIELYRGTELLGSHVFEEGPIAVGTAPDNDIVLDDERAASEHAVFERGAGGKFAVRDCGSGAATLLNGVPVVTRALTDGDEVLVGDTWLVIRLLAGDGDLVTAPDLEPAPPLEPELEPEPTLRDEDRAITTEEDTIGSWLNTPDITDLDELDLALPWDEEDIESTFDGEVAGPDDDAPSGPRMPLAELDEGQTLLGLYRVGRELGREAGVVTYDGEHERLQRPVRFVLLHRSRGLSMSGRERYLDMIRGLAEERHPNLPEIFDGFELQGQVGAVLEAVQGESLRERITSSLHTPMTRDEINAWVGAMLGALQIVHGRGDSLGGLNPDGVIRCGEAGPVVVTGVVQPRFQVVLSPNLSSSEHIAPTLDVACYMAPEWIAGGTALDGRADLYAVGAMLYEMLTGRCLFDVDSLSDMLAAQLDREPDFSPIQDTAPELVPVLERVLAKDPEERFRDVAALRAALSDPASVQPPGSTSGVFRHLAVMLASPEDTGDHDAVDTLSLLSGSADRSLDPVVVREHILKPDPIEGAGPVEPAPTARREERAPERPQQLRDVFDVARDPEGAGGALAARASEGSSPIRGAARRVSPTVVLITALGVLGVVTVGVLLALVLRPRLGEEVTLEIDQNKGEVARLLGQTSAGPREVVVIPGGAARIGARPVAGMSWSLNNLTEAVRSVPPFLIDRHEVSRGDYATCVEAGVCPDFAEGVEPNTSREAQLPMTRVTWTEADAYCRHVGMRLPTEEEWEKAARGPRGLLYPWGDDFRCGAANVSAEDCDSGERSLKAVDERSLDVSPYGVLNMAGNAWEWTADWYYEPTDAAQKPTDARDSRGQGRVVKGGDFGSPPRAVFAREWNRVDARSPRSGFRCARSLPDATFGGSAGALLGEPSPPNHVLDELLLDAPNRVLPRVTRP